MRSNLSTTLIALAAAAFLAGCGGGGGSAGTSPFGNGSGSGTGSTGGTTAVVASTIEMLMDKTAVSNNGQDFVKVTALAKDANGVTLANVPIAFKIDGNGAITPAATVTDATGTLVATASAGSDRSNRLITVEASSNGKTASQTFQVTGSKLTGSTLPLVAPGASATLTYTLVDTNSNPMVGLPITVAVDGQAATSGTTDAQGKYDFAFTAPAASGVVKISAAAAGVQAAQSITVQPAGSGAVPPAVGPVQSASVQVAPSVLAVNATGGTTNQAEVRALVYGSNNKPIEHVRVRFDVDRTTSSDAQITIPGGASYAYTDANGIARATLVAGKIGSPTDGVRVSACYRLDDVSGEVCPAGAATAVTITNEAFSVAIGTDNTLSVGANGLTYIKKFVVMATDAVGAPKPGLTITPSLDLTRYYKGTYAWNGKVWVQQNSLDSTQAWGWSGSAWNQVPVEWGPNPTLDPVSGMVKLVNGPRPFCPNEDQSRNAVIEVGEDLNGNGSLEPRKSSVTMSIVGSNVTDASGMAVVQIEYAKNFATWIDYVLTVKAKVGGSEGSDRYIGDHYGNGSLPILASDLTNENVAPAAAKNPLGQSGVCTDTK